MMRGRSSEVRRLSSDSSAAWPEAVIGIFSITVQSSLVSSPPSRRPTIVRVRSPPERNSVPQHHTAGDGPRRISAAIAGLQCARDRTQAVAGRRAPGSLRDPRRGKIRAYRR
jgi:hypothetical protein